MSVEHLLGQITVNQEVMVGKPVISGTRLTVEYIVGLLAQGETVSSLLEEYPGLQPDAIRACLLFAAKSLSSTSFLPLSMETE